MILILVEYSTQYELEAAKLAQVPRSWKSWAWSDSGAGRGWRLETELVENLLVGNLLTG